MFRSLFIRQKLVSRALIVAVLRCQQTFKSQSLGLVWLEASGNIMENPHCLVKSHMGMDQYLLIPFLGG
jgi:hypothetical protein